MGQKVTKNVKKKVKVCYILLALMLVGSFSLLFSLQVESRTQAAILFDNSAYEAGEQTYKEMAKAVLEEHECYNSGMNLTRIVELSGERTYSMEVYNYKFDFFSGEEMAQIIEEVENLTIAGPGGNAVSVEVIFAGMDTK